MHWTGASAQCHRLTKEDPMLNLDQFVADCRAALGYSTPEVAVKEIVERAVASPSEVEAALGTPREGKIGVLHHDRDLTILNVVWTPGMAVYPHDHRMWAVIGLYGGREDRETALDFAEHFAYRSLTLSPP